MLWISSLTALMMIIIGTLLPSAIFIPTSGLNLKLVDLPSTWQISSLILSCLVCGQQSSLIATIAYLTIGLFFLPVFQGGGSLCYILTPEFGYLIGFIPSILVITAIDNKKKKAKDK